MFIQSYEGKKGSINADGDSVDFNVPLDPQNPKAMWLEGLRIGCEGQIAGESISLQLHHPVDGHLTDYDFGKNINLNPGQWLQWDEPSRYWARLDAGLIIKVVYNKDAANVNTIKLYVDFMLHKER